MHDNNCFGCGPHNAAGLRIKSYWDDGESVCVYRAAPHQNAGPPQFMNGGIIATVMDCHCVCTAIADAYRREGRAVGSEPTLWYVTGSLAVRYLKPTPIDRPAEVRARITQVTDKKTVLQCSLTSDDVECATGEIVAIRVPPVWRAAT